MDVGLFRGWTTVCVALFGCSQTLCPFFRNRYSDAPALSTDNDGTFSGAGTSTLSGLADPASPDINDAGEQWDDEAMAATLTKKVTVPVATASSTAELMDMKALDLKRNEKGDIAEKLRVEETKAQLAAAREGMEREARRIKEEKEKKEQGGADSAKPRFGNAAAGMTGAGGGTGAKWVPVHMRSGGAGVMPSRLVGGGAGKLDTQDENLFPDLAAAAAITEQQKNQQPAFKIHKKTPVGGGATWGAKLKKANEARKEESAAQEGEPATPASPSAPEVEPPKDEAVVVEQEVPAAETAAPESTYQETAEDSAAAAAKAAVKPKKKKKKDLSTFKPSD